MRKILAFLVAAMLLSLTGCGLADKAAEKVAEKAIEKATGVSVDEKGNSVTIKGQDGQTINIQGSDTKLPDGFPFEVYSGGKVNSGSKMTSNGKVSYVVEIGFKKGDAKKVADFYEQAMKAKGFTITNRTDTEQDGNLSVLLMGENEKQSFWVTVDTHSDNEEGTVGFLGGDKE